MSAGARPPERARPGFNPDRRWKHRRMRELGITTGRQWRKYRQSLRRRELRPRGGRPVPSHRSGGGR